MGKLGDSLLHSGLSLSPTASHSILNASFYLVYYSFWNLTPFTFPAKPVTALDSLFSIKFCFFLSPFRMISTNPSLVFRQFLLRSTSLRFSTLSGTPPIFTNLFRLAFLFALLFEFNLYFLLGALA